MPIAHIHILEGRTLAQKRKLAASVTEAISESIGAPLGRVRVIIHEVSKEHWVVGGVPMSEAEDNGQEPL